MPPLDGDSSGDRSRRFFPGLRSLSFYPGIAGSYRPRLLGVMPGASHGSLPSFVCLCACFRPLFRTFWGGGGSLSGGGGDLHLLFVACCVFRPSARRNKNVSFRFPPVSYTFSCPPAGGVVFECSRRFSGLSGVPWYRNSSPTSLGHCVRPPPPPSAGVPWPAVFVKFCSTMKCFASTVPCLWWARRGGFGALRRFPEF